MGNAWKALRSQMGYKVSFPHPSRAEQTRKRDASHTQGCCSALPPRKTHSPAGGSSIRPLRPTAPGASRGSLQGLQSRSPAPSIKLHHGTGTILTRWREASSWRNRRPGPGQISSRGHAHPGGYLLARSTPRGTSYFATETKKPLTNRVSLGAP